jgi:hypothetical protein
VESGLNDGNCVPILFLALAREVGKSVKWFIPGVLRRDWLPGRPVRPDGGRSRRLYRHPGHHGARCDPQSPGRGLWRAFAAQQVGQPGLMAV